MAKKLRDIDAAERARRLQAIAWTLPVALLMGGPIGGFVAGKAGANVFIGIAVGILVVGGAVYASSRALVSGAGDAAQVLHAPSGNSTPYKTDFSLAASLVARGRYDDAAAAYEVQCIENPQDPEPHLRLAWLYRDNLQQYDEALAWFVRARGAAKLTQGQHVLVIQEIVDLYVNRLKTPGKAIPELAQLCAKFPGTPGAAAAGRQLHALREMVAREREGAETTEVAGEPAATAEIEGIRAALRKAGGDSAKAAKALGLSPYDLAARIDVLRIGDE